MTTLPITLTIAAAAALINVWLAVRVSLIRRAHNVLIGDGGIARLTARMRAHANFVENTPFFMILLAIIELSTGSETWLWIVSIIFILGRFCHAFGMERDGSNPLRMVGTAVTWAILVGLAAYAISIPYLHARQPQVSQAFASGSFAELGMKLS